MAKTGHGKIVYVPNPNPHPHTGDAPRTGVPVNPVPHNPGGAPVKHAKEVT